MFSTYKSITESVLKLYEDRGSVIVYVIGTFQN